MDGSPSKDAKDLNELGYPQQLQRSLGGFSSFAAGFSYISIFTGMFQMFYLGFGVGGPRFFWTWPVVFIGQFLVALGFAELAAHYPISGSVYQWSKRVGSPFLGWVSGWIYLLCLFVTFAAVALALQGTLPQISPIFQMVGTSGDPHSTTVNAVILGSILILISTVINSVGVRILALLNNIGVFSEIIGIIVLIGIFMKKSVRSPKEAVGSVQDLFNFSSSDFNLFLTSAALTASYVLYGFDTAGSLAEETLNPRKHAPQAILRALFAAGVAGLLLLLVALMAAPSLFAPDLSKQEGGLQWIVIQVLGPDLGRFLLIWVVYIIFVCALAVQSGIMRLIFSMARDRQFPWSDLFAKVSEKTQIPVAAAGVSGAGGILILIANIDYPKAVELITSIAILWANLAYAIVTCSLLYQRLKGWPDRQSAGSPLEGWFALGRWGVPINVLAALWSLFMVVNVGWPRAQIYGTDGLQRYMALIVTGVLLVLGTLSYFLRKKFSQVTISVGCGEKDCSLLLK